MIVSIVDTETTDLSPDKGKLLEVAVVNFDAELGDVIEARSFLVHGAGAEEIEKTRPIHGISPDIVERYGSHLDEVIRDLKAMTASGEAFLAHNAEFDMQWLPFTEKAWVCTKDDIQWPNGTPNMSLASLALSHGVGMVSAHRAMDDCMTIARVLKRVAEKHDLVALVRHGMRPKAKFKAIISYEDREVVKKIGFHWDADRKMWWRKMAIDDAKNLGFQVIQIA